MGTTQSINILNNAIDQSINILNTSYQGCFNQLTNSQVVTTTGCSNTVVSGIGSNSVFTLRRQCQQEVNANNKVQQEVVLKMQQAANSIAQSLGIQGSTTAENISNMATNLGITISNTYAQNCSLNLNASQTIIVNCNNAPPGNVLIRNIGIDAATTFVGNCTQQSDS